MTDGFTKFIFLKPPAAPDWAHAYAFEMSDGTTKIGISHEPNKRTKNVSSTTKHGVLRVYQTQPAPLDLIRTIEATCHARFAASRVHGEFFNITFEEACAELALYENDIAAAAEKAEAKYRADAAQFTEAVNYFKDACEYRQLHAACEKLNEYSKARGVFDEWRKSGAYINEVTLDSFCRVIRKLADKAAGIDYRRFNILIPPEMIKAMECDDIICRTIEDGMAAGKSSDEIYKECERNLKNVK